MPPRPLLTVDLPPQLTAVSDWAPALTRQPGPFPDEGSIIPFLGYSSELSQACARVNVSQTFSFGFERSLANLNVGRAKPAYWQIGAPDAAGRTHHLSNLIRSLATPAAIGVFMSSSTKPGAKLVSLFIALVTDRENAMGPAWRSSSAISAGILMLTCRRRHGEIGSRASGPRRSTEGPFARVSGLAALSGERPDTFHPLDCAQEGGRTVLILRSVGRSPEFLVSSPMDTPLRPLQNCTFEALRPGFRGGPVRLILRREGCFE
jgi:hypothetical protein